MKKIIRTIALSALLIMGVVGCQEAENQTVINPDGIVAGEIEVFPTETITIDMSQGDATAAEFQWSAADFSFHAAVQYTLLGTVGKQVTQLGSIYSTELQLTNSELNTELVDRLGATPGQPTEVEVALLSSIGVEQYDVLSQPVVITVVPFVVPTYTLTAQ